MTIVKKKSPQGGDQIRPQIQNFLKSRADAQADRVDLPPPIRAKDMLHGTALFVRDMLEHQRDELLGTYGIRPDEAAESLRYVELAELRLWGIEEMFEAVTAVPNQASSPDTLRRRITMAMRAEAVADFIHPGDAVLLLERSGLMLSSELREAVAYMSAGSGRPSEEFSDEDENRLRRLLGRPLLATHQTEGIATALPTGQMTSVTNPDKQSRGDIPKKRPRIKWDDDAHRKLYAEFIQPGATIKKLAEKHGLTYEGMRKQISKAEELCKTKRKPSYASKAWKSGG
jgi:transposase-like protein